VPEESFKEPSRIAMLLKMYEDAEKRFQTASRELGVMRLERDRLRVELEKARRRN
jgi:hypothetical protein